MKRIISSALVIMLTIGAAQAQTTEGHQKQHNKEQRGGKAFEQLNLTADQKARMQTLRDEFKKSMSDLKANQQLSEEEKKTRRKTLHEQFRSQSEAVLTPAQKEQLSKLKADRKEAFKNGNRKGEGRGQGAGRGFEKLQQELNLTTDQQSKMSNLRSEYKSKFESLRNDKALSEDQKKTKMRELATQQFDQMKAVLTPDQIQKLESMRGQHNRKGSK